MNTARPVERSELLADPASRLRMTSADELGRFQREREMTIEGPANPYDAYIFGTQEAEVAVFAFYDQSLKSMSWVPDGHQVFTSTGEVRTWGWCKARIRFRLAIVKPGNFPESFYKGRTYRTVFDARLIGRDPELRCPAEP